MSPWKVILATLVIFCSGLVTGGLMVKNFSPPNPERPHVPPALSHAGSAPTPWHQQQRDQQKEFLRRIDRELNLTAEQREKIESIMKASQDRTKAIRDKIAPELKDEIKKLREEIRAELTPEQQKKYEEVVKPKVPKKGEDFGKERPHRRQQQTNSTAPISTP